MAVQDQGLFPVLNQALIEKLKAYGLIEQVEAGTVLVVVDAGPSGLAASVYAAS